MIALYPIKPRYTNKILSGEKIFELRKRLPSSEVNYILIYSTSPVAKIVGYAKIKKFHSLGVDDLWSLVSDRAGIDIESYNEYFSNSPNACAIEFDKVYRFNRPFNIKELSENIVVPQSFCYIDKTTFLKIKRRKTLLV